jgi:dTDP-4-dehydrorhamnose reductase
MDKPTADLKRVLVFGAGGKLGSAVCRAFQESHVVDAKVRNDVDITQADPVRLAIEQSSPDVVINSAAFVGIDACEHNPQQAIAANTHFPKLLAELSNRRNFLLVHISTDAVFNGTKQDFYTEADCPKPINVYGMSKYGGDCCVEAIAHRYYILRIPLLFGENPGNNQFVEKMLTRLQQGETQFHISNDIVTSPSFSTDIAQAIKGIVDSNVPYGLYHLANEGQSSLYELIRELVSCIQSSATVNGCSHTAFPSMGMKNTCTPIRSVYLPPLRSWRAAFSEYCSAIRKEVNHG